MLRTLKKSISALLAAVMIFSGWSLVWTDDGPSLETPQAKAAENENNYEVEVLDKYEEEYTDYAKWGSKNFSLTFTYTSQESHGRLVNGRLYVDENPHHEHKTLQEYINQQSSNTLQQWYDQTGGELDAKEHPSVDRFGLRVGTEDSDEIGVILHVKAKYPQYGALTVSSSDPSSGTRKHVYVDFIRGDDYDQYYFVSVDVQASKQSEIRIGQGEGSGFYILPLEKGIALTRTYIQENEYLEQSGTEHVVSYVEGKVTDYSMVYVPGYNLHFQGSDPATPSGAVTNDTIEYRLYADDGQDITSSSMTFSYDNDDDPTKSNYKKDATVTVMGSNIVQGHHYKLKMFLRSLANPDLSNLELPDLYRAVMTVNLTITDPKPITSIYFGEDPNKTPTYELTTQNTNTIELADELTYLPVNTTDKVVYESENPSVATVNPKTGRVTAVSVGEATIVAHGKYLADPYAECTIRVRADISSIIIDELGEIVQGHSKNVSYRINPTGADPQIVQWTSSDPDLLRISGPDEFGIVTLYAVAGATISGESKTVTVTAKSTVGSPVTVTKSITVKKNVSATEIVFKNVVNADASPVNLSKSCQEIVKGEEYNIYDDQSVKITSDLNGSTDALIWRLTVDDGRSVKDVALDSQDAQSFITVNYTPDTYNKELTVKFKQAKNNVIKLTAYAVNNGDSLDNYHAEKTIIFHVNKKTSQINFTLPSGSDLSYLAEGEELIIPYTLIPTDAKNIDDLYIRSDDKQVFTADLVEVNGQKCIKINAIGAGSAHLLLRATYNKDLTESSNEIYYTSGRDVNVTVKPNIADATVSAIPSQVYKNAAYTENDIASLLTVKMNGRTLIRGTDYNLSLTNNTNAGDCTVTISAINNGTSSYAGKKVVTFKILPYDFNASYASDVVMTVDNPNNYTYTGAKVPATASIKVTFNNQINITRDRDFTLDCTNNVNAGTNVATITATGKGNYTGTISRQYTINPRNIYDQGYVKIDDLNQVTYTGGAFTPDIVARNIFISTSLRQNVDYTLSFSNNINAGNASVVITGIGNYGAAKTIGFNIKARDIKDDNITVAAIPNQTYNTKDIKPDLKITYNGMTLVKDVDYSANYSNNNHAGKATVTIIGKGNYNNGTDNQGRVVNFTIDPYVLTAGNTTVNVARAEYTGKPLTPNVDVKVDDFNRFLDKTNECTISRLNNIDAGNGGIVKVVGKGDYAGTFTYTFKIEPTSINNVDIEAIPEEFYDGTEHKPDIVAKNRVTGERLQANVDYYLEYENNINQGMAKVFVTGLGNYAGSDKPRELSFRIAAANIANATFSSTPDQTFIPGEGIRPSVAVVFDGNKLVEDKDYRVEYRDNYNVGTATMTFIGLGDFGGKYEKTFKIKPFKLTSSNIKITLDEATYDGKAKTPFVKVELKSNGRVLARNDEGNGDYKVTFSNNVNAGNNTASVVITGTNNFTGSVTQKFSIKGIEIARAGNEGIEPKAYTGKAITPKVKLTFGDKTLKEGTDYKLSYKDNVKPGEATIVVTGLGNFFGTKEIKFRIKPAAVRFNADSMDVVAGDTKRMPFDADEKVTWTSSNKKVCTVNSNGEVTGKMAGKVTITGKSESGITASITVQVLYKDVTNTGDFWYKPTYYLTNVDVVKGYDNQTTFKPANECTRGQMVTFLWRLQGCPNPKTTVSKFKDVKKSDYFFKAVLWGNENHIVEGYKDGTFGPKIVCQRKHAVTFMWRLAGKPNPKTTKNKFSDVKTKDYFYKAVLWASEKKIVEGYAGGKFKPDGNCLRRQMVTFLYKYDKFVNGKG